MPRAAEKEVDNGPECRIVAAHHHGLGLLEWHYGQIRSELVAAPSFPAKYRDRQRVKSRARLDFVSPRLFGRGS